MPVQYECLGQTLQESRAHLKHLLARVLNGNGNPDPRLRFINPTLGLLVHDIL